MSWLDQIGNTPLIPWEDSRILLKLEGRNPAGSAKDRAAQSMLQAAREQGLLHQGGTVIEATSGNTGIALAALSAALGFRCVIVMPENMSRERIRLMTAYGAEVILSPALEGMAGAVSRAKEIAAETQGAFYVNQFANPANSEAHYRTTGPEIWRQSGGKMEIFVAGVGTGGTVSGVGRYLKEQNPRIQIIAVEPAPGEAIPGIGPGFLPPVLDTAVVDVWFPVTADQAAETARRLARARSILAGPSSGAALFAAQALAARPENRSKTIVALLPDSGERYLSTGLFGP